MSALMKASAPVRRNWNEEPIEVCTNEPIREAENGIGAKVPPALELEKATLAVAGFSNSCQKLKVPNGAITRLSLTVQAVPVRTPTRAKRLLTVLNATTPGMVVWV